MKSLVLAAGYATRLYPLTENFPKPLLKVRGKAILDWLIEDIASTGEVDEFIVISNHKFAKPFDEWRRGRGENIVVIDDGTTGNDNRLGAVRDIQYAVECRNLDDDLLVIAGDNLLDFSLGEFIRYAKARNTSCIMRYYEPERKLLLKSGVVSIDGDDRVTEMTEKSPEPATHWCCPPFYFYPKRDVKLIRRGIEAGCGVDAPGSFVAWLCRQVPVHAMEMPGKRYDIGDMASYREVQETYRGLQKADA